MSTTELARGADALIVVGDWVSEYYFTAEAKGDSFQAKVLERRKAWDSTDGHPTSRSRFLADRIDLETGLAALYEQDAASDLETAATLYASVRAILGYASGEFRVRRQGPALFFGTPGVADSPLVIIETRPLEAVEDLLDRHADTLLTPYPLDPEPTAEDPERPAAEAVRSTAALLSRLFLADDGPTFALVQAGRWLFVTDESRWAEGRYLAVDLQTVAARNAGRRGGEIDKALTCVEADSLAPDADGTVWWSGILADSVKHTVGVSKDLREGVRRSIEVIANDVVSRRAAQGLDPLPPEQAQPLAVQSLRFLYRILFLLYAEASPELGVLPVKIPEYEQGYSLDRLRELVLTEPATPQARAGTHLYASLKLLFELVDGRRPARGLEFNPLRADLFRPEATALIDEVGLSNLAMQRVLESLLLSKKGQNKTRGFISYVDLGINQLGAVYEGLMSYTGLFAAEDLFEVAKDGNAEKGSWVVPVNRAGDIAEKDFVREEDSDTGERRPVLHRRGTFVFRLSGRERQQSASYYTPEVLTRFTVGQALEELLDQDGQTTPAEEILDLTVCEPALGSGAFAIEAVRQLAEQYLTRRQAETGHRIPPDEYPQELQRVKAYLALHQVYGVDLNATAVELAEISLWLDTMARGLEAPWFGLRLRRGNSLIGARHAVYSRAQVNDKTWLTAAPTDVPMTDLATAVKLDRPVSGIDGRVHQFLMPAAGWGATAEAKEVRELAPDVTEALRRWRREVRAKPTKAQLDLLVELSRRVEALWQLAYRRLRIAEAESRRDIPIWGRDAEPHASRVSREQIEASLADPDGAYRRLRLVMDAWCALWFWPLHGDQRDRETRVRPPSFQEWITGLQGILGRDPQRLRKPNQGTLAGASDWDALAQAEQDDLAFADARPVAQVLAEHPWLRVCREVADRQGFFHWELDFATVFAGGGFDLQLGNPPWVRPTKDPDALLAEGDPWWQLAHKPSETERAKKRRQTLDLAGMEDQLIEGTTEIGATSEYVGATVNFSHLAGLQPDSYRCFMLKTWANASRRGSVGLIHPETHFTDQKAGPLRATTYSRLRRHWQFSNEMRLFEIQHEKVYGVHIYGAAKEIRFLTAAYLLHPETIARSMVHDGSGLEPGIKTPDGSWDLRPHANRIMSVDRNVLSSWCRILRIQTTDQSTVPMVYTVNRSTYTTLAAVGRAKRVADLPVQYSPGWHETGAQRRNMITERWGQPTDWRDVILNGSHLHVNNPQYKYPRASRLHNLDTEVADLESLGISQILPTAFQPAIGQDAYDRNYDSWTIDVPVSARNFYRVGWRCMAPKTGSRILLPAILPEGCAHVDSVYSVGIPGKPRVLVQLAGFLSSLVAEFLIRSVPKSTIRSGQIDRMPFAMDGGVLDAALQLRILRLNCLTDAWAKIWEASYDDAFVRDCWTTASLNIGSGQLGHVSPSWTAATPLRRSAGRRQAQLEIDVLVALLLDIPVEALCALYRTQFGVQFKLDRTHYYDLNGRLVPNAVLKVWRATGNKITSEERTHTNQAGYTYMYELPFGTLDREEDMRRAYAEFGHRLAETKTTTPTAETARARR